MTEQRFVSWHAAAADLHESGEVRVELPHDAPFAVEHSINRRLVLSRAEPCSLAVDALVMGNNEQLSDRTGLNGTIFRNGGAGLEREAADLDGVRTGTAKLTEGHGLAARKVIHAVGPRYRKQYAAAAESALHWCYRMSLQLCRDHGLRSVAFLPLHDAVRKRYPDEEAVHVVLRTIRRFLERRDAAPLDVVMLLLPSDTDVETYSRLAPLYFPRTHAELHRSAAALEGWQLGDSNGEVTPAERQIRVGRFLPESSSPQGRQEAGGLRAVYTPSRGPSEMSATSVLMSHKLRAADGSGGGGGGGDEQDGSMMGTAGGEVTEVTEPLSWADLLPRESHASLDEFRSVRARRVMCMCM